MGERPATNAISEQSFATERRHLSPGLGLARRLAGRDAVEVAASGATVTLSDGRSVLDLGSYAVPLIGHRHPAVCAAVAKCLDSMPTSTRILSNPITTGFVEMLVGAVGSKDLSRAWIGLSGADVVEVALKLARWRTGRRRVVALEGGYHGKTIGALAATSSDAFRSGLDYLLGDVVHVERDDASAVERELIRGDVAAFIFEPVQGEAGAVSLDFEVLRTSANLARRSGAAVIADEVQTGFRCGSPSLAISNDIEVDCLLLGKSLGGGVMPLSALLATEELFEPLRRDPFRHSATFSGHPLACAAGRAFLEVMPGEYTRSRSVERVLRYVLDELERNHPEVVRIGGSGLLLAIEFSSPSIAAEFLLSCLDSGVLTCASLGNPAAVRLLPPTCLTDDDLHRIGGVLMDAAKCAAVAAGDDVG
jgi:putrescine aminotransferase